jgi:hypothetical protein
MTIGKTELGNRLQTYKEWSEKHKLRGEVKPGIKIDVRDKEHVWCVGEIELKITSEQRKPLLYIHYVGWGHKYNHFLYSDSSRIAPLGLYTER